jgi:hypothetical protein
MLLLQPFDCLQHLSDLIVLGRSFIILNIDSRITLPGCFINPVAAAGLPWFAEQGIANFAKVRKPYCLWIASHLGDNGIDIHHSPCDINIDTVLNPPKGRIASFKLRGFLQ